MSKFTAKLRELHEAARKGDSVDSGVPLREWIEAGNTLSRTLRNAIPAIIEALEAADAAATASPGLPGGFEVHETLCEKLAALDALAEP